MFKFLLFGLLFLFVPVHFSFGEDQPSNSNIFIFVQTTLRDSNGTLVLYLESSKFTTLNISPLESFLDHEMNPDSDPIIVNEGQPYQVIRRSLFKSYDAGQLVGGTTLSDNVNGNVIELARFAHDGYTANPGDTLESIWTFVRPIT